MAGPPQLQAAGVGFAFFNERPHHHREAQLPPRVSQRWPRALHWKKAAVLGLLGAGRTRGNKRSGAGGQTELRCGAPATVSPQSTSAELEAPPCLQVTAPPLTIRDKSGCSRQSPFPRSARSSPTGRASGQRDQRRPFTPHEVTRAQTTNVPPLDCNAFRQLREATEHSQLVPARGAPSPAVSVYSRCPLRPP